MPEDRLHRLKMLTASTDSESKRTHALWLILTYYNKSLTTSELFSYVPFIWEVDILNHKFFGIRQKIENEIKVRQNKETIIKLIELLKNDNPYLRFFGANMLNHFNNEIIIEPLLNYLRNTSDDMMTKRQAICALQSYNDQRVKDFLNEEYKKNETNQDAFFRANYLWTIEGILKKE